MANRSSSAGIEIIRVEQEKGPVVVAVSPSLLPQIKAWTEEVHENVKLVPLNELSEVVKEGRTPPAVVLCLETWKEAEQLAEVIIKLSEHGCVRILTRSGWVVGPDEYSVYEKLQRAFGIESTSTPLNRQSFLEAITKPLFHCTAWTQYIPPENAANLVHLIQLINVTDFISDVLPSLTRSACQFFGGDSASFMLYDSVRHKLKLIATYGSGYGDFLGKTEEPGRGAAGWAFEKGSVLVIRRSPVEIQEKFRSPVREDLSWSVVIPVVYKDKKYGVLNIHSHEGDPPSFASEGARLLSHILGHAFQDEERSRFQALLTGMARTLPRGIIMFSRKGDVEFVNDNALELLSRYAFPRREIAEGTRAPELLSVLLSFSREEGAARIFTRDGLSEGYISVMMIPYQYGNSWYFIAVLNDLTDIVEGLNKDKITKVIESAKESLAAIQHHINNPLCYVSANIEYLKTLMQSLDDSEISEGHKREILKECRAIVEEAYDGVARLTRFMKEISLFLNPTLLDKTEVDIREMLLELVEEVESKNLMLSWENGDFKVCGNPRSLREMFKAVIDNALQVAKGDSTVQVKIVPARDKVSVMISDEGPGMSEEEKAKSYFPFFTTHSDKEHFGLGLSKVYDILNMHGGWLDIRSRRGEGTVVVIQLPRSPK